MKKLVYYIPAIITLVFVGFVTILAIKGSVGFINPIAWILTAMLFIAAILLAKKQWWGFIFGLPIGIVLIYMGMQETGQIFKEWPIGVAFVVYYIICAILSFEDWRASK